MVYRYFLFPIIFIYVSTIGCNRKYEVNPRELLKLDTTLKGLHADNPHGKSKDGSLNDRIDTFKVRTKSGKRETAGIDATVIIDTGKSFFRFRSPLRVKLDTDKLIVAGKFREAISFNIKEIKSVHIITFDTFETTLFAITGTLLLGLVFLIAL
ncbi:MAG: hypothetical protein JXR95_10085 [Deltaproteobacteria bacterium]|nr:hypothetical protein [Deltaproteobacteria bacterium]